MRAHLAACRGVLLVAALWPRIGHAEEPYNDEPRPPPSWVFGQSTPTGSAACDGTSTTASGEPLTLARAISVALCNNPRTRIAWAGVAAQGALLGQARGGYLPHVAVAASRSEDRQATSGRDPTTVAATGANLTLNWLLYDFGVRRAALTQAERGLEAAVASRDAGYQDTVAEVGQAWYEAQSAAGAVAAAQVAEATAGDVLKAVEARQAAGMALALDALRARNVRAQASLQLARAQSAQSNAQAGLARVLGWDLRTPLALLFETGSAAEGAGPPQATLEQLIGQALAAHPALRAARAQVAAAEARVAGVRAERWPSLNLSYGNYRNGRPNTALSSGRSHEQLVALTVSIPLFDGFNRVYREQEQQAALDARQAEAAATESRIAHEVWRGYHGVVAETAAVTASEALVQGTQAALDATQARYVAGAADIAELLSAQRDRASAGQERVAALAAWRQARLRLLANLGASGFWAPEARPVN